MTFREITHMKSVSRKQKLCDEISKLPKNIDYKDFIDEMLKIDTREKTVNELMAIAREYDINIYQTVHGLWKNKLIN